jgi:hypothetical protein
MLVDLTAADHALKSPSARWHILMTNHRRSVGIYRALDVLRELDGDRWTPGPTLHATHEPGIPVKGLIPCWSGYESPLPELFLATFGDALETSPRRYVVGFASYDVAANVGYLRAAGWMECYTNTTLLPWKWRGLYLEDEGHFGTITVFRIFQRKE